MIQAVGDGLHGRGQATQSPPIKVIGRRDVARLDAVDVRVHDVEAVRVPELQQELPQRLADRVDAEQVAVPRQLVRQEVPAERVRAVAVDDVPRHDDVAERLRHLLALGVGDVAEAEDGLERALVVEQRGDRDQAVEPAAGLVDRLTDVVGRVLLLEFLLILERRVPLRERHRAGVEPDVDHLGHAAQRLAAGRRRDLDLVHERAMRIVERDARELTQLLEGPDADRLARVVAPDRQRRAPVALAAQRPVDVVLQPAPEAAVLDVLGVPLDALVGRQQPVLDLRGRDVPGRLGVVEQRRAAAPAVRVAVEQPLGVVEAAAAAQVLDQVLVGVLDEAAGVRTDPLVVGAVGAHRIDHVQAVLGAEPEVVLAERDRGVDDAGAVLGRHEVARQHGVALLTVDLGAQEREGRLVAGADHVGPLEAVDDLRVLSEHAGHERLGQHLAVRAADVRQLGIDGDGGVGDQRPGRRGPDEQRVALAQDARGPGDRVADEHARVLDVLVAERHLVAGQRRAVARAVRDDLEALVEQLLVPQLAQRPPDRLDVVGVERPVRMLEVDPVADPLGQPRPVLQELEHGLAALLVELRDPVLLDLLLALDPELVLHGDLDRQAVAVPAALALGVEAAHRLVAREDVLEDARQHVVRTGAAVGGRRPLVEDIRRRALAAAHRLPVDVALAPALEDLLLEGGKRHVLGEWAVRHAGESRLEG